MIRLTAYSTTVLSLFTVLILSFHPLLGWVERSLLAGLVPLLSLYVLHLLMIRRLMARYLRKPSVGSWDPHLLTGLAMIPSTIWMSINFLIPFDFTMTTLFHAGILVGSILGVASGAWLARGSRSSTPPLNEPV